jgi:hypothetical protein
VEEPQQRGAKLWTWMVLGGEVEMTRLHVADPQVWTQNDTCLIQKLAESGASRASKYYILTKATSAVLNLWAWMLASRMMRNLVAAATIRLEA